jgi:hypothetical protein
MKTWISTLTTCASIAALAAGLTACSHEGGHRIPIGSARGDMRGKPARAEEGLRSFIGTECLDLAGLTAALAATEGRTVTLYTNEVDVGTSTLAQSHRDFVPTGDESLRGRIFKANPPVVETAFNAEITAAAKLHGLLAVKSQDRCDSVTFVGADGHDLVFKVQPGGAQPRFLDLYNETLNESRRYAFDNDGKVSVRVYTSAPVDCASASGSATLKRAYDLIWGPRSELEIARNYLINAGKHLTLPPSLQLAPEPRVADVDYADYLMFQNLMTTADFTGVECK